MGPNTGVSLHETPVIDNYGTDEERRIARKKDTDRHWWEVKDEWIKTNCGIGGLCFLDDAGFRYYLPAYMSYWLRTGKEPDCLIFHLNNTRSRSFDTLFTTEEKEVIADFLNYIYRSGQDDDAKKALSRFWGRFLTKKNNP